jgi:hypothetical protein
MGKAGHVITGASIGLCQVSVNAVAASPSGNVVEKTTAPEVCGLCVVVVYSRTPSNTFPPPAAVQEDSFFLYVPMASDPDEKVGGPVQLSRVFPFAPNITAAPMIQCSPPIVSEVYSVTGSVVGWVYTSWIVGGVEDAAELSVTILEKKNI